MPVPITPPPPPQHGAASRGIPRTCQCGGPSRAADSPDVTPSPRWGWPPPWRGPGAEAGTRGGAAHCARWNSTASTVVSCSSAQGNAAVAISSTVQPAASPRPGGGGALPPPRTLQATRGGEGSEYHPPPLVARGFLSGCGRC